MSDTDDERSLFEARAAWRAEAPPPFAGVLARVRRERRARTLVVAVRRVGPWAALAAAAASLTVLARRESEPPAIAAEPISSVACYDDPRSLEVEAAAYASDRAVASAEDRFAACLVATPGAPPSAGACAAPLEADVTCGFLGSR